MSENPELRAWIRSISGHILDGKDIQECALEYLVTAQVACQLHDEATIRAQHATAQAESRRDYFKACLEELATSFGLRIIYEDNDSTAKVRYERI